MLSPREQTVTGSQPAARVPLPRAWVPEVLASGGVAASLARKSHAARLDARCQGAGWDSGHPWRQESIRWPLCHRGPHRRGAQGPHGALVLLPERVGDDQEVTPMLPRHPGTVTTPQFIRRVSGLIVQLLAVESAAGDGYTAASSWSRFISQLSRGFCVNRRGRQGRGGPAERVPARHGSPGHRPAAPKTSGLIVEFKPVGGT